MIINFSLNRQFLASYENLVIILSTPKMNFHDFEVSRKRISERILKNLVKVYYHERI